jgi:hypothetical protein
MPVDSRPIFDTGIQEDLTGTPAATPEEAEEVAQKKSLYDKLLAEKGLAKYKLEVNFGEERSLHRPFGGIVTWWESATKLHGGGDAKLYLCDNNGDYPELEGKGCKAILPDSANGLNFIACPKCGLIWRNEQVVGEIWYKLPMQKWADVLYDWFRRLEMNADIRIKYARADIRTAAMREQERQRGGEVLAKVREELCSSTYPLANIIKDTAAGADTRGRILAYLQA